MVRRSGKRLPALHIQPNGAWPMASKIRLLVSDIPYLGGVQIDNRLRRSYDLQLVALVFPAFVALDKATTFASQSVEAVCAPLTLTRAEQIATLPQTASARHLRIVGCGSVESAIQRATTQSIAIGQLPSAAQSE